MEETDNLAAPCSLSLLFLPLQCCPLLHVVILKCLKMISCKNLISKKTLLLQSVDGFVKETPLIFVLKCFFFLGYNCGRKQ